MTAGFHEQEFSLEERSDQQAGLFWGMAGWLAQGIHRHGKHVAHRQASGKLMGSQACCCDH